MRGFSMCVQVESNPSCHPGSAVACASTSTSSGGEKEKHAGDKKATGPLSPILIPNHSQHKAPQPRRAASEGIPAGLTSYLPAKIPPPKTGSHCWRRRGRAGRSRGSATAGSHSQPHSCQGRWWQWWRPITPLQQQGAA